ncbi:type I DNA topoisomerase [Allohahella marinimesophila]|uniref:DNA topoisomerase 1 n=1 Tax=Allohahella marinimesophila TaxID=1054972 RepID=A0ABP7QBH9_9GAMM
MAKSLVIVESPAKAKTINKYLGPDFIVKSSVGHVRDLPTGASKTDRKAAGKKKPVATKSLSDSEKKAKAKRQLFTRMGVDPEHDWEAEYEVLPGKEKVVEELRRLAKTADHIYLATDLDREGEAIAWHLRELIGGDDERFRRVVFNEITKNAISDAFKEPGTLNIDRVNAQQARRFLDRVVGFMVSPLLWSKIARGLSAGRVQSVAVKLIVEREREIRAFVPEEYWQMHADLAGEVTDTLAGEGKRTRAQAQFEVTRVDGKAYRPQNRAESEAFQAQLEKAGYKIAKREDKPTQSKPSAPFITSTLQQGASNRLGFSVSKTMRLAQKLYEAGYITYMRTDSTNLSADAVSTVRDYIVDQYGKAYCPEKPRVYSSKEGAQEAHEAIRPTDVNVSGEQLQSLERDAERLYTLIWKQFVACQMENARFQSTTLVVEAGQFELRTRGRVMEFPGFLKVLPLVVKKDEDAQLPPFKQGDVLDLEALKPTQHFTKPTARFTEATLVKELEKQGIGRPSTYASIISTIQDRGYVRLENKRFFAEKMGDIVTDRLTESFKDLMSYGFTASMEERLDAIATGKLSWKTVLDEFYSQFSQNLEHAESTESGMRANEAVPTSIACPTCARPMQIRTASTGVFLGCSGYSLPPKERCKTTLNLTPGDEAIAADDDEAEAQAQREKRRCPVCSTAMDNYLIDEHRKLHVCGNNPDCPGHEVEEGHYKIKGYEGPRLECDKCGAEMQLKNGRFGKYFGCTAEDCKNTRKLLRNGDPAPPKMDPVQMPELKCTKVDDHYVLRDGASGLFLAASQFPKNRETRAPLVTELLPHKNEIDPKYAYLMKAPTKDPEGRPAVIRFSRKTKEQYVMSEKDDGKPSGWAAYYSGSKWTVKS